jgi:hypothetical protein
MSINEGVFERRSYGSETVTMSTKRVLTAMVVLVRRAMQDAPNAPRRATTKAQAIQPLGDGIAINVVTLTSNRQGAKARGVRPQGKRRGGTDAKQRTPLRSEVAPAEAPRRQPKPGPKGKRSMLRRSRQREMPRLPRRQLALSPKTAVGSHRRSSSRRTRTTSHPGLGDSRRGDSRVDEARATMRSSSR